MRRLLMVISFAFAAVVGACSVANPSHCANLDGNATCAALDVVTPYCSRCIADNNGCVADRADSICDAGSTSVGDDSTSLVTTTAVPTTGPDITTSTTTSSSTTADPTTTTTSETTESTSTTTSETTDTSTGTTADDTTTGTTADDTTTGTTAPSTTTDDTTTTATTLDIPFCGDGVQENPEVCDGNDLGGFNCAKKNPVMYSGGTLKCVACYSFDESDCCLAPGQSCLLDPTACCPGTSCKLLNGNLLGCG